MALSSTARFSVGNEACNTTSSSQRRNYYSLPIISSSFFKLFINCSNIVFPELGWHDIFKYLNSFLRSTIRIIKSQHLNRILGRCLRGAEPPRRVAAISLHRPARPLRGEWRLAAVGGGGWRGRAAPPCSWRAASRRITATSSTMSPSTSTGGAWPPAPATRASR